ARPHCAREALSGMRARPQAGDPPCPRTRPSPWLPALSFTPLTLPASPDSVRADSNLKLAEALAPTMEVIRMDPNISAWIELVLRWTHVVAGIMWIGFLYFFNFVNAQVAKTYDADSKKKVVPELMPRTLYFFRWGAAYTLITGILLLWVVYWAGNEIGRASCRERV